jgi:hypothetical protein
LPAIRWGNPVDKRHPWNQTTLPRPQKRDFSGNYTRVMSPRWYDQRTGDHLALDAGGGPIARLWSTALSGLVDIGYVKATGHSIKINLPKTALLPEAEFEWKSRSGANHRTGPRSYLLPGIRGGHGAVLCRKGSGRVECRAPRCSG